MPAAPIDGDHERLLALLERYERPLYRFLVVLTGDREAALDCAQDTFVRAYEQVRAGRDVNARWLFTVARNRAMDEFRRKRKMHMDRELLESLPATQDASPEGSACLREAYAALVPDDRAILYLSAVAGFSGAEIAAMLGIQPNAVRMRVHRARERFRLAYGGGA